MDILLASNNKHKAEEIIGTLRLNRIICINILLPSQVSNENLDVEESGSTLEENALIKAEFFYKLFNIPTIADDTGLEIDALGGQPGVYSARFAGRHGDDKANRLKVLSLMENIDLEKRTARFRTVICFINKGKNQFIEGICRGRIIEEERGTNGFGYDPIFVPDGYDKTFAEMTAVEKNQISHRGRAIKNFARFITEII